MPSGPPAEPAGKERIAAMTSSSANWTAGKSIGSGMIFCQLGLRDGGHGETEMCGGYHQRGGRQMDNTDGRSDVAILDL